MTNKVSAEEYQLRALESQYIEDLRVKNRTIAELRTRVQLLTQQLQEHTHDDEGTIVPLEASSEDAPTESRDVPATKG